MDKVIAAVNDDAAAQGATMLRKDELEENSVSESQSRALEDPSENASPTNSRVLTGTATIIENKRGKNFVDSPTSTAPFQSHPIHQELVHNYPDESNDACAKRLASVASEALEYLGYMEAMHSSSSHGEDDLLEDDGHYFGLAYLDFPDSRYVIRKACVIIGRPPENHLTLAQVPDSPANVVDSASSENKNKRKWSDDGDEESGESAEDSQPPPALFTGGLGGPQEHGASYIDGDTEFINIFPPVDKAKSQPSNIKAISKRHLRLMLDDVGQWQLDVLGRNGVLINHDFYPQGSQVLLNNGDNFWIADISFSFNVPGVETDELEHSSDEERVNGELYDSAEADSHDESYDIVSGDEEGEAVDLNEEDEDEVSADSAVAVSQPSKTGNRLVKSKLKRPTKSNTKKRNTTVQNLSDSEEEHESIEDDLPSERARPAKVSKAKLQKRNKKPLAASGDLNANDDDDDDEAPRKRGPGRPPKDGVMSKRARRALQKAAELDRDDTDMANGKVKTRPRKVSEPNGQKGNRETKKAKKTKRNATDAVGANDGDVKAAEDSGNDEPMPPPPPREPSPKETDFQEHELQKPDKPYSVCLYHILREAGRSMALPEIYEVFKKRWPYYRFRVKGDGWQSSVRHNLQSTDCLVTDGRSGKGHLWTIDPNVPLGRANARTAIPSVPQGPYKQSGQNQHFPMRGPTNAGTVGYQSMQNQVAYMHGNANGQRQPPAGPNPSLQQYQSQNSHAGHFAPQNQGQFNAHGQFPVMAGPNGIAPQRGMPVQNTGRVQGSTPSQQIQFHHSNPSPPNTALDPNANVNQAQNNGGQSSVVPNVHPSGISVASSGMFSPQKQQAFDVFRNKLLSMAQNANQRTYYVEILDLGEAWCAQHAELDALYDGPRNDVGQIVKAFQESWEVQLKKNEEQRDSVQENSSNPPLTSNAAHPTNALPQTNGINSNANPATIVNPGDAANLSNNAGNSSPETSQPVVPNVGSS